MPIVIEAYENDLEGGFFIRWRDPAQDNLVAYIHATPQLMDEFIENFRTHRGAPSAKLENARDGFLNENLPDAARVQRFRLAYSELLEDIIDLRDRNLKHDTPHDVHMDVRGGGKPDSKWLLQGKSKFDEFIGRG